MLATIYRQIRGTVRRDFVQRITVRNGLRPTSGRIRKAAPVTVAPDVVTSTERRDEAHDSSVSLVRHVVLLLKLCCADGDYMVIHRATVYQCPLTWWDSNKQCESEQNPNCILKWENTDRLEKWRILIIIVIISVRSKCSVNWYFSIFENIHLPLLCLTTNLISSRKLQEDNLENDLLMSYLANIRTTLTM